MAEGKQRKEAVCLEIKKLSKSYAAQRGVWKKRNKEAVKALNNVSFSLTPGLYGLLGPNGAGKSTLINIITTSLHQDEGVVCWGGSDIRKLGIEYRRMLGYMPQQQTLYATYTGKRFLLYMAALKEIPKDRMLKEAEEAAASVGLLGELDKRLGAYSGGMKQRLLVAGALLGAPPLLVMDEPTAGLDPKERVRLRTLLTQYAQNSIVLVATHVVSDVETAADKIMLLKKGSLVDMAAPDRLIKKYAPGGNMEEVYLSIFGAEDEA